MSTNDERDGEKGESHGATKQSLSSKRDEVLVELSLLLEAVRRVSTVLKDIEDMTTMQHAEDGDGGDDGEEQAPGIEIRGRARSRDPPRSDLRRDDSQPPSTSGTRPSVRAGNGRTIRSRAGGGTKSASVADQQRLLLEELNGWTSA
jgi:hypothetical protein